MFGTKLVKPIYYEDAFMCGPLFVGGRSRIVSNLEHRVFIKLVKLSLSKPNSNND
jgi:hypothetical protein